MMTAQKPLTKKQAEEQFRELMSEHLKKKGVERDTALLREEWNNWTDMLHKDGQITDEQYDKWTNPL